MTRLRKRRVLIYTGQLLSLFGFEEFLESEEMPVDTLAVCCPGGVLEVAGYGEAEEFCSVYVLSIERKSTGE